MVSRPEVLLPDVGPGGQADEDRGRGQPRRRADEGPRSNHDDPHEEEQEVDARDPHVEQLHHGGAGVIRIETLEVEGL